MYEAAPPAKVAWRALFGRVFADVGVQIRVLEHRWPDPIASLWSEPGLCCAFMCGLPFVRSSAAMQVIAAPVPRPARYASLPRYCSEFLVRAETGWTTLKETLGHRYGWMAANSQSGFNAPRAHLVEQFGADRESLFAETRGPYGTPARTLSALRSAQVDVVAIDTFYLDVLRRHDRQALSDTRTVAQTTWTPIPLLVAAPAVEASIVARLQAQLLRLHADPTYAPLLADAVVERFVVPNVADYQALKEMAEVAARLPRWS